MNKFLPNLLLVLSLGLCGLCTFQWKREGRLRNDLQVCNDDLYKKKETIRALEQTLSSHRDRISQLELKRDELTATNQLHAAKIRELTTHTIKLERDLDSREATIHQYKDQLETANQTIKQLNEGILVQNQNLKALEQNRDDAIAQLKKVVGQYNELAKNFKTYQEQTDKVIQSYQDAVRQQQEQGKKK